MSFCLAQSLVLVYGCVPLSNDAADPHPGNMMRTNDGKLAILDFGLMTEATDNQKYGMIEAIAHLLNQDYTEIGQVRPHLQRTRALEHVVQSSFLMK